MTGARRLSLGSLVIAVGAVLATVLPGVYASGLLPLIACGIALALGGAALKQRDGLAWQAIAVAVMGLVMAWGVGSADRSTVGAVVSTGLFIGMLQYATPLVFAGLGGLVSERSGVVNIGLEGMMLTGAFAGYYGADKSGSWVVGVLCGAFAGGVAGLIHAVFAIHLRADQIVSGTAINILAAGGTAYAFRSLYGTADLPDINRIPELSFPSVPVIGAVLDGQSLLTWLAAVLAATVWFVLFRTPFGLRLRAVGEHPRAADTVGIRVFRMRYLAVGASGMLAGLGGAYLSVGYVGSFTENMTSGRGFIALAAMIFGKWRPSGLIGACLLFGFASALGDNLQTSAGISADFTAMLPYILTLVALVGFVGRSVPPRADGIPYRRQ